MEPMLAVVWFVLWVSYANFALEKNCITLKNR